VTGPALFPLLVALLAAPAAPEAVVLAGPFSLEEAAEVRTDAPLRGRIGLDEPLGTWLEILLDGERVLHTRGSRNAEDWWLADPAAEVHLVEPESGVLVWSYRPGGGFAEGEHEVVVRVDVDGELLESEPLTFVAAQMPDPEPLLAGARAVPNPMSPVLGTGTRIRFTLAADASVTARVYDREGGEVGEIFSGALAAGDREIAWDGRTAAGTALANGVYLVRLQADASGWTGSGRSVIVRVAVWNER
jgi:hypothetical protein